MCVWQMSERKTVVLHKKTFSARKPLHNLTNSRIMIKRKFVTIGSIAILFILLQADVTLSRRGGGRSRSSSSSIGWWGRSHHKSSKSTENSRQSVKTTGYLANGASAPQHNPERHPNYPTHYNKPSFKSSFFHNNPSYSQIFALDQDHTDSLRKLLKFLSRSGYVKSSNYPYYVENSGWDKYTSKPWKPTLSETTLKPTAGAVATVTTGGFLLGCAAFAVHFHFNHLDEERWWYENCERYADRVSFLKYKEPAPEDVFVRDCWNVTMREFVAPSGNETADEMESRVLRQVVHQMCVKQYRTLPQLSREDSFQGTNKMRFVTDATSTETGGGASVTYVLSRPVSVPIHILTLLFCLSAFLCY